MNKYERYKKVDLPWLEEVPEHWEVKRNKSIFKEKKEVVGERFIDYKLLSLTLRGVIERNLDGGGKFPASFEKYVVVKSNDFVFCLFDMDETPRTIGLSLREGMITGAYTIFEAYTNYSSQFLNYFYLYIDSIKGLKPYYSGLRKTVNMDKFNSIKIPIPPLDEQEKIAAYLDWKINKIDRLIGVNNSKIEEIKKYIISVHEQILLKNKHELKNWIFKNNTSDFKDSELKITKIKNVLRKIEKSAKEDSEIVICSNSGKSFLRGDKKIGLYSENINMYQNVDKGQLMIHGMDTWHGAICISDYSGRCTRVVHVCETTENKLYIYFYLRLLAFLDLYKPFSNGVRQNTSDFRSWEKFGQINIILPSRDEQNKVADELIKLIRESEMLIEKITAENDELFSLKNSLISEVVTGKIDVRNAVIPSYEKVDIDISTDEKEIKE
ncbi:restriction endonuclease subunit S [Streptococcus mitis]|jgi:hypothetical protein|uniref:restriction endonuclease subunit S n=1 Tax=Streptococcus mitis TaxID=28037 RepID=UPI0021B4F05D|nr:restriction endonuclease subunit S [Streptococcus mitis]